MRHTCEHCTTAYEIPDDKVAGRFLKVRCKRCRGTMHVVGLKPLDAAGENGAVWWCAIGQAPRGPYREDEVMSLCAVGDVHARTRMWCAGMNGWERVCESQTLAWVYNEVIARATEDPSVMTTPSCVFARAALLSDGNGYFPDPTLHSGIIVLDDQMQKSLERLAATAITRAAKKPKAEGTHATDLSLKAPILAAAIGATAAAAGIFWFIATATA